MHNYEFDKDRVERFEQSFRHEKDFPVPERMQYTPQEAKAVINRLSRAIGHLESIKSMIADGRDCAEILIQLSAVKSAVNNAGIALLQSNLRNGVVDAIREGDTDIISELNRALGSYIK